MNSWYVYIIKTINNKLYTGITNNLEARLEKHKSGKGAKFLRVNAPLKIVYTETVKNRSEALKREYAIKQLSRKLKDDLIQSKDNLKINTKDLS